jgi:hypothetical protein
MGLKVRFWKRSWYVFIDHRGRRRAKKIGDRETALTVARRIRERPLLGDLTLLGTDTETLTVYATRWLTEGEKARKVSTHRFYRFNLDVHILPVLGSHPVGSVSRAECRKVLAAGREKGLKIASLAGVLMSTSPEADRNCFARHTTWQIHQECRLLCG